MRAFVINNQKINDFIDWLIYIISYTIILITVSILFDSIYIDNTYFGFWALIASIIIYILNRTIKPILFILTLPITGLTLGLFYPFINVFILKIADFILGLHFQTDGIFILFFVAILISILNFLMDKLIVEPIVKRGDL
ncbi:MAG: phage holin family protein [Bacilli bacterium]|jgi:putative membrane protein|nr:phage holin family protein [Bacilli bacterium]